MQVALPSESLPSVFANYSGGVNTPEILQFMQSLTPKKEHRHIDLVGKGANLILLRKRAKRKNCNNRDGTETKPKYIRESVLKTSLKLVSLTRKMVSRKGRKQLGLLKLPRTNWNYASLQPVRDMWQQYMKAALPSTTHAPSCDDPTWESFSATLAKAEFVGAEIAVVRSRAPTNVGVSGTVVLETKCSFQIVTKESQLKCLLKEPSVFTVQVDNLRISFFGKHIMTRASEKSVRKIKLIMKPDL